MLIERTFAWFSRDDGGWLGERRCLVPTPQIPPTLTGADRIAALSHWQQGIVRRLDAMTVEERFDVARWEACPSGGAVCLDVTRFAWPVGDHVWHRWDDVEQALDWPESSGHKFIQVERETKRIVANWHTHRPIQPCHERMMIDITGSAYDAEWGNIWGRFVLRHGLWTFAPDAVVQREIQLGTIPERTPLRLAEGAPDIMAAMWQSAEKVLVKR